MRVLFDMTHPAHVHYFKNVIRLLVERGHEVQIVARQKEMTTHLLDALGLPYVCLIRPGSGLFGMGLELIVRNWRMLALVRRFRPDVLVGATGVSVGPVGAILGIPRLVREDAEHARLQRMIGLPLATRILTGLGYFKDLGKRQVRCRAALNQAYLDPPYFQPNAEPLRRAGVDPDEPYIVLRLVSWQAAHDFGLHGASDEEVHRIVERLSRRHRVLISSERPLPATLKSYESPVPVQHMHDLLAFAALYIGEGGTMAVEAAILGIPAIFCNPLRPGLLLALEKSYGLVHNTNSLVEGVEIAERWLNQPELKAEWQRKRRRLLDDTEDVNRSLYGLIEETAGRRRGAHTAPPAHAVPTWSTGWRRWLVLAVRLVLLVLVLYFVGRAMVDGFATVPWGEMELAPLCLALAVFAALVSKTLGCLTYYLMLGAPARRLGWRVLLAATWIPPLGKYVPGKVASVAWAVWLLRDRQVPGSVVLRAVFFQTGLSVVIGLVIAIPLMIWQPAGFPVPIAWLGAAALLALGLAVLHPRVFLAANNLVLRVLRRPPVEDTLSAQAYLGAAGTILGQSLLQGLAMWLMAGAFAEVSAGDIPLFISATSLANTVGFLAIFAPAGLGVREGLLLVVLGPVIGPGQAAILAAAMRLIQVLLDVVMAGAGYGLLRGRNTA